MGINIKQLILCIYFSGKKCQLVKNNSGPHSVLVLLKGTFIWSQSKFTMQRPTMVQLASMLYVTIANFWKSSITLIQVK